VLVTLAAIEPSRVLTNIPARGIIGAWNSLPTW
jgi:hypothetical protein